MASIHQPSTQVFNMFDRLQLMAHGHVSYSGYTHAAPKFFGSIGHSMPLQINPADFM
jgi:ATP-binding cassette, subfamily G (WHITE), member 2